MEGQLWRHVGGIITQSTNTTPTSRARSLIYFGYGNNSGPNSALL